MSKKSMVAALAVALAGLAAAPGGFVGASAECANGAAAKPAKATAKAATVDFLDINFPSKN